MTKETFEGNILFCTSKAIRFQSHYWAGPLWLPMSQVEIVEEPESLECVVKASPWICGQKGLKEFTHYDEEAIAKMDEFKKDDSKKS